MNWKATVAMVAVAVGLGAYVYFVEAPKPAPTDSGEVMVWRHDGNRAKEITRFAIKNAAGEVVYQQLPASGSVAPAWKLASEPERDLESWQFDMPLADTLTLKADRKVEDSVSDPAAYGFQAPTLSIALGTEKEPRKLELVIGEKNPLGSAYYAKASDGKVYLVSSFKVDTWTRLRETPPLEPLPTPAPDASSSSDAAAAEEPAANPAN